MKDEHETPEVPVPGKETEAAPSEKDAAAAAAPEGGDGKDATEKEPKAGEQPEGEQPPAETPEARETKRKNAEAAKQRIREREEEEYRRLRLENARLENQRLKGQGGKAGDGRGEQAASSDEAALKAEFERENPKPKEADFKTFEEYTESVADWVASRRDFVRDNRSARESDRIEREREREARTERLATQREKGEAEFEDFAEVIDTLRVPRDSAILPAIYDSPDGHRVGYYLAQNPKEVARIAALPTAAQFREIGRIEAQIEAGKIQLKRTTKAPPPPATLGGKGEVVPGKLSDEDALKKHRAEKLARMAGRK